MADPLKEAKLRLNIAELKHRLLELGFPIEPDTMRPELRAALPHLAQGHCLLIIVRRTNRDYITAVDRTVFPLNILYQ